MRKYTIKSGDSWWKIANENGMTVEELKNLNPEIKMHPGQILSLKKSVLKPILRFTTSENQDFLQLWGNKVSSWWNGTSNSNKPTVNVDAEIETILKLPKAQREEVQREIMRKLGKESLGKWGVDGNFGNTSKAAYRKFREKGYTYDFSKQPEEKPQLVSKSKNLPSTYSFYPASGMTILDLVNLAERELKNAQISEKEKQLEISKEKPTFDEWLYITGAQLGLGTIWDFGETLLGSIFGFRTESGEGAQRQALAQMINPIRVPVRDKNGKITGYTNALHYDGARRYFGKNPTEFGSSKSVGNILIHQGTNAIPELIANASNFSLGQTNEGSEASLQRGGAGWTQTSDGGYWLKDGTDYHMLTVVNPNFNSELPESDSNPKYININKYDKKGNLNPEYEKYAEKTGFWSDIKSGITNPATLFENQGSRKGWVGGYKEIKISPEQIEKYRQEYEAIMNDPHKLAEYYINKENLLQKINKEKKIT